MGKIKKSKALNYNAVSAGSLAQQILMDKTVRPPGRVKERKRKEETIEVGKFSKTRGSTIVIFFKSIVCRR